MTPEERESTSRAHAPCTARERARLPADSRLRELHVERGMPISLWEPVLQEHAFARHARRQRRMQLADVDLLWARGVRGSAGRAAEGARAASAPCETSVDAARSASVLLLGADMVVSAEEKERSAGVYLPVVTST
jgi:hypothetical protein